ERLDAYRARRGGHGVETAGHALREDPQYSSPVVRASTKRVSRPAQSQLPFGEPEDPRHAVSVGVAEAPPETSDDDFSFTIAIGRYSAPPEKRDGRLEIDVSVPPGEDAESQPGESRSKHYGLYPVASLEERSWSAVIDIVCLLFAYGGFLALF